MPKNLEGLVLVEDEIRIGDQSTNYTQITNLGNISQQGSASAALGDVTTASLKIGSAGTDIQDFKFGSISPCFNAISACSVGTGSATITGLTKTHYVFVTSSAPTSPCLILASVCPLAGKIAIELYNEGNTAATSMTCPWAYFAIK